MPKRTVVPANAKLIPPEAEPVFKGIIYDVYHWQQKMYDGTTGTFEMLKRPDTVKIVAIKNGKIVILEEQQPHLGSFYEIPGGMHDVEGETELEAAKRELREETGMRFRDWKLLNVFQPSDSIEQLVYIFLANNFEAEEEQSLESGEKIEVKLLSLEEVKQLLNHPKNRYLPKDIFEKSDSIEGLLSSPPYKVE